MRREISTIILLLVFALYSCNEIKKSELQDDSIPIIEQFSSDAVQKKALFIFPHADDETICSGTISKLKEQNYEVGVIILTDEGGETRHEEFLKSMKLLNVDYYEQLAVRLTNYNSWNEIIENRILDWEGDTIFIKNIVLKKISDFNPSIIFTWDNMIGGYGHPDHYLLSRIINDVFDNQNNYLSDSFRIEKLYMVTLSEGLENHILRNLAFYEKLISRYNRTEIPPPDIAVIISKYAEIKKKVLLTYKSEYKSALSKFYPNFRETDANKYFEIYDREYYIIKHARQ